MLRLQAVWMPPVARRDFLKTVALAAGATEVEGQVATTGTKAAEPTPPSASLAHAEVEYPRAFTGRSRCTARALRDKPA
jgi:hypothetical protein